MTYLGRLAIILLAGLMLAGMLRSNPDYNSTIRPFTRKADWDQTGQARLMSGRILDWHTAEQIQFQEFGHDLIRKSEGIFLIVDLALTGRENSSKVEALWIGSSQRRYSATKRITGLPRQIDSLWLQPGLESKTFAIFELPADEVEKGAILLGPPSVTPLDDTLLLEAPPSSPPHRLIESFAP